MGIKYSPTLSLVDSDRFTLHTKIVPAILSKKRTTRKLFISNSCEYGTTRHNPLAANVLGTIGTVCWCVQLAPQIWRNHRTKSTEGLPAAMMFLWSASAVPFGVYAIVQKFNIPLIVQPQCFCLMCGVSWAQCLVYGRFVNYSYKLATGADEISESGKSGLQHYS